MKKITLKNLHEATAQEVFDQCAVHLLTQKEKCAVISISGHSFCRYKNGNKKCAAGCFIDENEYNPAFEGRSWDSLVASEPFNIPAQHKDLICNLQGIHDSMSFEPMYWKEKLIQLALENNLNTNAINNIN